LGCRFPFLRRGTGTVVQTLVGPLGMIVFDEFPAEVIHVPSTKHHELIEALLLYTLCEPLDESRCVGRGRPPGEHPALPSSERCRIEP
jgi:hypothetical protein